MSLPVEIRPTLPADGPALADVSRRADALFAGYGFPEIADMAPAPAGEFAEFLASGPCLTAVLDGRPVGFALLGEAVGMAWLREIAVDPDFGRRGIGSALLEAAASEAAAAGHARIGLTTFRAVPFNAPFYARQGFQEVLPGHGPPEWLAMVAAECPPGIDPAARTLMVRRLAPAA